MGPTPPIPPPPQPPAPSEREGSASRPTNPYRIVGLILLLTPLLPGIVLYAIVASIFGEDLLERSGEPTSFGQAIIFVPNLIGGLLTAMAGPFNRRFPMTPTGLTVALALAAALCLGLGIVGVINVGQAGDANIGGGILVIVGLALLALATFRRMSSTGAPAAS